MRSEHKFLILLFVFAAVVFLLGRLAAYCGSSFAPLSMLRQGALPYLVGIVLALFIVVPLANRWMNDGQGQGPR